MAILNISMIVWINAMKVFFVANKFKKKAQHRNVFCEKSVYICVVPINYFFNYLHDIHGIYIKWIAFYD